MAGPIAEAFVAIRPEFGAFDTELRSNLARAERLAENAGEGIEDSFVEAATQSADAFDRFGASTFDDATRSAERAGEGIEDSFVESARQSEDAFNRLDKSAFREVVTGAERSGEQVEGAFREAARSSERALGGISFKKVAGGLAAAFAGVQLGSFFKDATLDAQRLNSAVANTEQVIAATGGAAGVSAAAIRASSQELSLQTGATAVSIQEASNILLTFKNIGPEAFGRTQQSALDLAAVLGGDASSQATALGKALNDPIQGVSALSRVGVTFTEQQKEQIRTLQESGDVLGAQTIILDEIEGQVGGAAEASADSTAKIGAAFTALKESVGQGLIGAIDNIAPAIIGIVDTLGPVASQLGDLVGGALEALLPSIENLIGGLAPLFDVLGSLIPILAPIAALIADVLVTAIEIFAAAFGPLLRAIGPVIDLLAGELAGVFAELAPIVQEVATIFSGLLSRAIGIVVPVIQQLLPIIVQIATLLGGVFASVLETIGNAFLDIYEAVLPLLPVLGDALLSVLEAIAPILPIIADLFAQVATTLIEALVPIIEQLVPLLAEVLVQLVDALVPILPILADLLLTLLDALLPLLPAFLTLVESLLPILVQLIEILAPLLEGLADILAAVLVPAVELVTDVMTWLIEEVLVPIFDFISANLGPALETLGGIATDTGGFFQAMGDIFATIWTTVLQPIASFVINQLIGLALTPLIGVINTVKTTWDTAWTAIETVWTTVIKPIYDWLDGTFKAVFGAIGGAVDTLKTTFDTAWGGIKSVINSIIGGINAIINGWNGIRFEIPERTFDPLGSFGPSVTVGGFGFGVPQLPTIPTLAQGGVVTAPTLAIVGDNNSGAEAIVPLERAGEFGFGGSPSGAVIAISNANFYDGTDADLVAQKTIAALNARRLTA